MAYLIDPYGRTFTLTPLNGSRFTEVEMQFFVGGYIDIVATPACLFIVDDSPARRGLAPNYRATALLATAGAPHILFGDVVICHPTELE